MTSTDQLTYERVRTELSALVLDGQYRVGDKLPSEKDLADRFGLGRGSIREALKRLQDDGLVHRRPGQGTFFSQPPPMYLLGASLLVPDLRHGPQPRVVHAELLDEAADAAWFAALRPPASATAGRPVLHLCRVHQHPHPIAVEDLWLDHLSVPTLYSRVRGARSDVGASTSSWRSSPTARACRARDSRRSLPTRRSKACAWHAAIQGIRTARSSGYAAWRGGTTAASPCGS